MHLKLVPKYEETEEQFVEDFVPPKPKLSVKDILDLIRYNIDRINFLNKEIEPFMRK